jgi:hypothetical protein
VTGDNIGMGILFIRSIAAAAAIGCGGLIWLALRPVNPGAAAAGMALWLWNPLVPLEAGMSGHNDLLLVAFLLAAFMYARSGRGMPTGAAWAAAASVKAAALLLVPILAWQMIRPGPAASGLAKRLLGTGAGVVVVVAVLFGLGRSPLDGAGVGALGADTERYTNSLHELILAGTRLALGDDTDDVRTPLSYRARYAPLAEPSGLWTSSGAERRLISMLEADTLLLVIAPAERGWRRVEEQVNGRIGYVSADRLILSTPGGPQPSVAAEPIAEWSEREPLRSANRLVRTAAYALFGLCAIAVGLTLWRGAAPSGAATAQRLAFMQATGTWISPW